jgi:hypothetical protein
LPVNHTDQPVGTAPPTQVVAQTVPAPKPTMMTPAARANPTAANPRRSRRTSSPPNQSRRAGSLRSRNGSSPSCNRSFPSIRSFRSLWFNQTNQRD